MIARILIPLLLLIALPDLYLHWHYLQRRKGYNVFWRCLFWAPSLIMLAYTLGLSAGDNFVPSQIEVLFLYLFLLGVLVLPKATFALCSAIGLLFCKLLHRRQNWGNLIGFFLALFVMFVVVYGGTIGFSKIEVNEMEYVSKDLPKSFDGYRIVLFSDAHVGTYTGSRKKILEKAVKLINEQEGDMVVFAGDLQNVQPSEIDPVQSLLGTIKAKDGVFSILGNHDYANYLKTDFATEALNESLIKSKERSMGWNLLLNENRVVRRGKDSIVVVGLEDNTSGRWNKNPKRINMEKAMKGISDQSFMLMLVHNPDAWGPDAGLHIQAPLTLSGHTHGGQFRLLGWSPVYWKTPYGGGWYQENGRSMYVSTGLGGLVPFRFGVPGEIAVITMKRK